MDQKDLIKYGLIALGAYLIYKYIEDNGGLSAVLSGTPLVPAIPATTSTIAVNPPPPVTTAHPSTTTPTPVVTGNASPVDPGTVPASVYAGAGAVDRTSLIPISTWLAIMQNQAPSLGLSAFYGPGSVKYYAPWLM
jgi:hypothetical protein